MTKVSPKTIKAHLNSLQIIISAILLTSLMSCALLSPERDSESEDPIARAVLDHEMEESNHRSFKKNARDTLLSNAEDMDIDEAIESETVVRGMKMNDVLTLWGSPTDVETAGDPRLGHQRWIYATGLSKATDINPSRVIYFEGGRVVGWENAQ